MSSFNLLHAAVAFAAAFAAGAINSVAGGGTLISFPTLIWLGLNSVTANATNTVAIWPGSLGGMWGFRVNSAPPTRVCSPCSCPASSAASPAPGCCATRRPPSSTAWCPF